MIRGKGKYFSQITHCLQLGLAAALSVVFSEQGLATAPQKPTDLLPLGYVKLKRPVHENTHYLDLPNEKLFEYLKDPKKRINPLFHVPNEINDMVGFWFLIYSKYSLLHTLIYDREHPKFVYEVIDTRDLFKKGLSPLLLEIHSKKRIRKTVREYKRAFAALAKNPRTKFKPNSAGAKILRLWGKRSKSQWREIGSRLRTQKGQRDRIMHGLTVSDRFLPAMEKIFQKFSLPVELTRIPLVESSFNTQAVSKADAVGVWQFLERSAREYLIVDEHHQIDERLSPIKATFAAAKMFRRNYRLLDDYGLAVIAYNHGQRRLMKIRKKYKGAKIAQLLKLKDSPLGYASRNYYAEFLALIHAEQYRDELYQMPLRTHSEDISIVKLTKPASIFEIAALYNISLYELRVFNPDVFNPKRKLPVGTRIVIPRKTGESLVLAPGASLNEEPASLKQSRSIASKVRFIEYIH